MDHGMEKRRVQVGVYRGVDSLSPINAYVTTFLTTLPLRAQICAHLKKSLIAGNERELFSSNHGVSFFTQLVTSMN
jgi:hypothetical protein